MSVKYHFFGKDCVINKALSDRADLAQALHKEDIFCQKVLFVNQVHGSEVVVVDAAEKVYGEQNLPKADALVTNITSVALAIVTADCSPVLLFDEENKIIAAAHAGWRGAKSGVISSVVKEMQKLGAKNIKAVIGPMIQQKSYEVSKEFFDDFLSEDKGSGKFFVTGIGADKYLFDLPSYVERKLGEAGVKDITNHRIDTYENESDLFSFRRSTHRGEKDCGRNVSVIVVE